MEFILSYITNIFALSSNNNNNNDGSSKGNIEISGKVLGNSNCVDSIHVYYDEKPTFLIYTLHKNGTFMIWES
jgi:hypothetical protein